MDVGTRLKGGRWHLDRLLATGGFSTVFSASHRNGSRAAIKILDTEFTEDADMRGRFLREGYAANSVGHPGVVSVLDDDVTEDGRAYLVMELLEGEALNRRRKRLGGKLPLAEVLHIADELLDVLAAAHAHGIIHRDIKPANIFLTTQGQIKILDFGFAKIKETALGESTAVGTLIGTPGFLPPECARGQSDEVDARTDIWSAGATIFRLVSGAHVHEAKNSVDLIAASGRRPPRSLASVAPELPPAFVEVIDRALAFAKDDRWPSASAMQKAIREVAVLADQTGIGPVGPFIDAEAARAVNPLATSGVASPSTAAEAEPLPRLYDDLEDGGTKGLTEVMMPAIRPAIAAAPAAVAVPNVIPVRPPPALWPFVVGAALALLGIALGVAAFFPAGR